VPTVYQYRLLRPVSFASAILGSLFCAALVIDDPGKWWQYLLVAGIGTGGLVRMACQRVIAFESGIQVVRFWREYRFAWHEIASYTPDPYIGTGGHLTFRDGRTFTTPGLGGPDGERLRAEVDRRTKEVRS
jgi:hypothetical protein